MVPSFFLMLLLKTSFARVALSMIFFAVTKGLKRICISYELRRIFETLLKGESHILLPNITDFYSQWQNTGQSHLKWASPAFKDWCSFVWCCSMQVDCVASLIKMSSRECGQKKVNVQSNWVFDSLFSFSYVVCYCSTPRPV